ncbi:MAG: ribosomal protein S18 acetylase RimI-like enzyme [Candidatus Azotimanducaceae bacterium]|jgi:ribosomal protein S18 acetylase RimI-like enzyme
MGVSAQKLKSSDYGAVACLHCNHINQGFLATLGVPFLTLLYEAIDKDSESVLLVERVDRSVVGFVSGTRGLGRIYKQLLLRPHRLIYALRTSILSPSKIYKILEVVLMNKNNRVSADLPKQELLSIVVNPAYQGKGHAENLFEALCIHFRAKGARSFRIVVGSSLARAHAFYVKMGCTPVKEIQVHKGTDSVVYIKECD